MQVSRLIIENIRENEIRLYLKSQGIEKKMIRKNKNLKNGFLILLTMKR